MEGMERKKEGKKERKKERRKERKKFAIQTKQTRKNDDTSRNIFFFLFQSILFDCLCPRQSQFFLLFKETLNAS